MCVVLETFVDFRQLYFFQCCVFFYFTFLPNLVLILLNHYFNENFRLLYYRPDIQIAYPNVIPRSIYIISALKSRDFYPLISRDKDDVNIS